MIPFNHFYPEMGLFLLSQILWLIVLVDLFFFHKGTPALMACAPFMFKATPQTAFSWHNTLTIRTHTVKKHIVAYLNTTCKNACGINRHVHIVYTCMRAHTHIYIYIHRSCKRHMNIYAHKCICACNVNNQMCMYIYIYVINKNTLYSTSLRVHKT